MLFALEEDMHTHLPDSPRRGPGSLLQHRGNLTQMLPVTMWCGHVDLQKYKKATNTSRAFTALQKIIAMDWDTWKGVQVICIHNALNKAQGLNQNDIFI